jgi:hypothetical protein
MDEIMPAEDRVQQLAQQQLFDMDRVKRALRKKDDGAAVSITKNVFGTHKASAHMTYPPHAHTCTPQCLQEGTEKLVLFAASKWMLGRI